MLDLVIKSANSKYNCMHSNLSVHKIRKRVYPSSYYILVDRKNVASNTKKNVEIVTII